MFGGAQELKGNGSFGSKEATETVACSESSYTVDDVHGCRMVENGSAGLATIVPRSLELGWDKRIKYYIKKVNLLVFSYTFKPTILNWKRGKEGRWVVKRILNQTMMLIADIGEADADKIYKE
ncbi:hypothetical protein Tco_1560923 [Tanacetum coccineum]